jgi:CRISPR-associated exonuclease Cas4
MIADTYKVRVKRGFICYTRSNNLVKEIEFRERDFERGVAIVDEILDIIQKGFYPKGTSYKARCVDCCYRRVCMR